MNDRHIRDGCWHERDLLARVGVVHNLYHTVVFRERGPHQRLCRHERHPHGAGHEAKAHGEVREFAYYNLVRYSFLHCAPVIGTHTRYRKRKKRNLNTVNLSRSNEVVAHFTGTIPHQRQVLLALSDDFVDGSHDLLAAHPAESNRAAIGHERCNRLFQAHPFV